MRNHFDSPSYRKNSISLEKDLKMVLKTMLFYFLTQFQANMLIIVIFD